MLQRDSSKNPQQHQPPWLWRLQSPELHVSYLLQLTVNMLDNQIQSYKVFSTCETQKQRASSQTCWLREDSQLYQYSPHSPLGTTMSADCTVGSMYCSNAGFTNLLYCLMMPLMFRPRWEMSLLSRRIRRMSESVSTNTFMSSSWQTGGGMFHQGNVSRMLHCS